MSTIWWLDALKSKEMFIQENDFKQKREEPRLQFNTGLTLIDRPSNNWAQRCSRIIIWKIGCAWYLEFSAKEDLENRLPHVLEPAK